MLLWLSADGMGSRCVTSGRCLTSLMVNRFDLSIALIIMLFFFLVLTLGFAVELGKNALKIESKQMYSFNTKN